MKNTLPNNESASYSFFGLAAGAASSLIMAFFIVKMNLSWIDPVFLGIAIAVVIFLVLINPCPEFYTISPVLIIVLTSRIMNPTVNIGFYWDLSFYFGIIFCLLILMKKSMQECTND